MITSTPYDQVEVYGQAVAPGGVAGVVQLQIERPDSRNALDTEHCNLLHEAVEAAVRAGARALVITGQGSSFCAGADFGEVYSDGFRQALYAALHAVNQAPLPVIAAVNGPAIGAGTQLAIACDFRVAAASARFAVPTAHLGLAIDPWTIRRLALVAGNRVARGMLMAGAEYDQAKALVGGLVDRVGTLSDALEWAAELARLAPLTLAYSKRVLDAGPRSRTDTEPLEAELAAAFEACWSSDDFAEGRAARVEKRRPHFRGR